jgi:hypothetical protein
MFLHGNIAPPCRSEDRCLHIRIHGRKAILSEINETIALRQRFCTPPSKRCVLDARSSMPTSAQAMNSKRFKFKKSRNLHPQRLTSARIVSSIVWLGCARQGCTKPNEALRAGFSFCGSTWTGAVEPGTWLVRKARRECLARNLQAVLRGLRTGF